MTKPVKVNDYTDKKYYVEPDDLEMSTEENEEFMENMYDIGLKPEDIEDVTFRTEYEKYLKGRSLK